MKRVKNALPALVFVLALFIMLPFSAANASEAPDAAESPSFSEPPQTCSINYNANGGVFPTGGAYFVQNDIEEGSWVTIIGDVPYAQGNNFAGWYCSADGNTYWGGQGFELTEHTTLWATWATIPMYSITLHFNTDDGFQSTGRYQAGYQFDLTPYTTNRGGYEFKGWSTDPAATHAEIAPGSLISLWNETNVYAVWEALPEETASSISAPPDSSLPQSSSAPPDSSLPAGDDDPQEADNSGIWKWLFILLVAAGAVAATGALVAGRRKKKQ